MLKSESVDDFSTHDFDLKSDSQSANKKYHSILPDLATGWRPKNMKISAPILITYEDKLSQLVFESSIASMSKVVYIGPRYDNSYKFHSLTQHYYSIKYGIKYQEVSTKMKKDFEEFTLKYNKRKTLFCGMNPSLEKQLQFQSNFESGNLDFVIKVSANEYNLFLRPDTNTRGHMQWFYFKINNVSYPHQNIRLNICNNRKNGVLFCRGMKPYIYSKHLENTKGIKWQQAGENISYTNLSQKERFFEQYFKLEELENQNLSKYYCLSFDYTFQSLKDEVYFAYCPPFTFSQMKNHIQWLKKRTNTDLGLSITEETLCTSLSGLQIPLLTITDESVEQTQKKCVVVTGRFHPGETNGSYVLKGFLDFLISPQASLLRKKIIFKVIPMINPDGVVFGNYRTSLSGKDLNRKFKAKNMQLFPQINHLKTLVTKLKRQSTMKILYYLDFHGHSIKKNVFLYGPQYDIWSQKYEKAKVLPKIIATKTNMFKYQSCLFRVAVAKRTTARAFMLGLIPYCYTIESSVGLYRVFNSKQNFFFDPTKWEQMGRIIGDSLKESIERIEKDLTNSKKKKKNGRLTQSQKNKQNVDKHNKFIPEHLPHKMHFQTQKSKDSPIKVQTQQKYKQKLKEIKLQPKTQKPKQRLHQSQIFETSRSSSSISTQQRIRDINESGLKIYKSPSTFLESGCPQINEVDNESDGYSEGKSDCQSDDNDFDKEEYKKISAKIMKFMENFSSIFNGVRQKNFRLRHKKKVVNLNKTKTMVGLRKFYSQQMKMVPSLKYKLLQHQPSQKKILIEEKQQQGLKDKKLSLYKMQQEKRK